MERGSIFELFALLECFRAISSAPLRTSPSLHVHPIHVVVFDGPEGRLISGAVSRLYAFSAYPFRT
jgi:hypothetical protein